MTDRSSPYDPPPAGYRWEAVVQGKDWRAATDEETSGRCRSPRKTCVMPPAAALNRRLRLASGTVDSWWLYCDEHMYGRWIEVDKVMGWRLVKEDE